MSHTLETQGRSSNLKGAWVRSSADLGEAEGNWNSSWGHRWWQQPLLGAHTTKTLVLANANLESSL